MNNIEKPNYYANLPANVRYADIPPMAKLLYAEITALSNKEGYCWASNQYFADLYNLSVRSVSRLINLLKDNEFISVKIDKTDRQIWLSPTTELSINPRQKCLHNTKTNIINNNDEQSSSLPELNETKEKPNETADLTKQANNVITYFCNTYKANSGRNYLVSSRGKYIKNLKKTLKLVDEWTLKQLIDIYLTTDDKFWEQSEWSLDVLIMDNTINKLLRIYGK